MLPEQSMERAPEDSVEATARETPPASVIKILNGAIQALADRGANRLSMSDISYASGVSRRTLYRYFKTKEDVLSAVGEHISSGFEDGVRAVARGIADPLARLDAVMSYHNEYAAMRQSDRMLLVDPAFVLEFFRTHSERHRAALLDALAPVFDHFDNGRSTAVDRKGVVDMMIRLQISRLILPADEVFARHWAETDRIIQTILRGQK